ncbi:MAG: Uma2 family endonuclease [Ardenticatenales bacterium]|nr:Uma2 family endonuclease [Ardenticatenales bacterium]MCB9171554.1 Uma2 family endonuclease [Ardenticatenales bacterium]
MTMDERLLLAADAAKKISYEQFLAWADEDLRPEWVDGEIITMSPASNRHQDLARFLTALLSVFVETRSTGVIRPAPFQMRLEQGREPDLLFVATPHLDRLKAAYLDGPADLVIEIITPERASRDRGDKFYEYEAGGVNEYWLIDPLRERVEFYQLNDGRYQLAFSGAEGRYASLVLPGFWLSIQWLWQETLPPVLDVLRELKVIWPNRSGSAIHKAPYSHA